MKLVLVSIVACAFVATAVLWLSGGEAARRAAEAPLAEPIDSGSGSVSVLDVPAPILTLRELEPQEGAELSAPLPDPRPWIGFGEVVSPPAEEVATIFERAKALRAEAEKDLTPEEILDRKVGALAHGHGVRLERGSREWERVAAYLSNDLFGIPTMDAAFHDALPGLCHDPCPTSIVELR